MSLLQEIQPHLYNSKVSLLIRHSDRHDIAPNTSGNDALLTEQGKRNALEFGKKLSDYKINTIITTHIQRCIQTAEYIAEGYGKPLGIEPSKTFAGLHINDWETAKKYLKKPNGYEDWYRNVINDKSFPGICEASEYSEIMTGFITSQTKEKGLTIFISHDFVIAYYHYALNKTTYTMFSDWVNYLSGLILIDGQYIGPFKYKSQFTAEAVEN